jgi:uncharacterized membrane protein required for colicin V production
MTITFSSFQALLLPMMLVFGFLGYRRGAWNEIGITAGMALDVLLTVFFAEQFLGFINRIIINIPRVFGLLLGNPNVQPLPEDLIFGTPDSAQFLLARVVLFTIIAFLVYSGRYSWAKPPKTPLDRILGFVLGSITGFFWFVAFNDFLNTFRALRGQPTVPPEGTTITIPVVDVTSVAVLVPTIAVLLLILIGIFVIRQLPKLWK